MIALEHGLLISNKKKAGAFGLVAEGWAQAHLRYARWENGDDAAY